MQARTLRAPKTKPFKIIFPYWEWKGTPEDHERLRKLEDECCERGLCTREELDNWKLFGRSTCFLVSLRMCLRRVSLGNISKNRN